MSRALVFVALALFCARSVTTLAASSPGSPPNVIFILVDDMGAADLGCQGSAFYETPHIDRLAREGMRFTQAYAACTVCSPTRAAVLTGKYPARLHITDWIAGHQRPFAKLRPPVWTQYLPQSELTLAEALGSHASVAVGKWHLGGSTNYPERHGFAANIGGTERGQPPRYVAPYGIPTLEEGPAGEFLTDRESAEVCRWIERHRERPFFVYLPHYAVHTPLAGKPEVIAKYKAKARPEAPQRNATYAALVESVDDSVGRIVAKLAELGLAERTIIFFTSDNGGLIGNPKNPVTSNLGLRAGKGSVYEGGVRVPLIVRWSGKIKPGSVSDLPVTSVDYFPTILELTGAKTPSRHVLDGESLAPVLLQTGKLRRDALFWHYPHYHPGGAAPYGAIRKNDWKLIEFYEDGRLELYDLSQDPSEQRDLAAVESRRAAALRRELAGWRKRVGAQLPLENPHYDPGRAGQFGISAPTPKPAAAPAPAPRNPNRNPQI